MRTKRKALTVFPVILFVLAIFCVKGLIAAIPDSISGCVLWLDGSDPNGDGSTPTGAMINWKNKVDPDCFAYQPDKAKQAEILAGGLNGLSVVHFSDGRQIYTLSDQSPSFVSITDARTIFWVVREDDRSDGLHFFLGQRNSYGFHRGTGGIFWDPQYAASEIRSGQTYLDGTAINGTTEILPLGTFHIVTLKTTGPVPVDGITGDRDNLVLGGENRSWHGDIAEIIIYNQELVDADRKTVENYLYDKWFVAHSGNLSIKGKITGDIKQGVSVSTGRVATTTDANGNYSIDNIGDGAYTVTPSLSGYTFSPASKSVTLSGANVTGIDFTAARDTVPKFTLTVVNGTGSGEYEENANIRISAIVPTGQIFDIWAGDTQYIQNRIFSDTIVSMPARNVTLIAKHKAPPPNTNTISGTISGAVRQGVTVAATPTHSARTDATGHYLISGLSDGSYSVTPTLAGYVFSPTSKKVKIAGTNPTGINFSAISSGGGTPGNANSPIALDDSYFVQAGQTLIIPPQLGVLANDVDFDGDDLMSILSASMPGLTLRTNGEFSYSPAIASGSIAFTYRANDGNANSNMATVTITVLHASTPLPPTAIGDKYQVPQNSKKIVDSSRGVLANDMNATGTSVTILTNPQNGILSLTSDGSFEYTPNNNFSGVDSFRYSINGTYPLSSAFVALRVAPVKITVGSRLNYRASDVPDLKGMPFEKPPKLYGVLENGKKGSFKKLKSSTGSEFSGIWSKKIALYDKKNIKSGYKTYFDSKGPSKPADITVMAKGKTDAKNKINAKIQVVHLVPPVITDIQNAAGNSITTAQPGATIVLVGQFFGDKPPKVALEVNGKLLKCKLDKKALKFQNEQGKSSAMDPIAGDSSLTIILPSKKLQPGSYPIVLDNKVGIATTPGKSGSLPIISIAK